MPNHGYVDPNAWYEPVEWREVVDRIGISPLFLDPLDHMSHLDDLADPWIRYARESPADE